MKLSKFSLWLCLVLLIVGSACNVGASDQGSTTTSTSVKGKKYYQVVMIWIKDPQKFQEYGQKVGPIVGK